MEIAIFKDSKQASQAASSLIARSINQKANHIVLGLATGQTPTQTYAELIKLHLRGRLSFKGVTSFNLDEYVGIADSDPRSYNSYMQTHLFGKIDIDPSRCHIPNGMNLDTEAECHSYEKKIQEAGGIDLQVLGLGQDAHLGFNEPSSSLASRTRLKTLTEDTRRANAAYFESIEHVPKHVLTMGLGTILEARHCVLLAFGRNKSDSVERMVEGPISASVPASILQMHPKCTVILDQDAAANLKRKDYYVEVFESKPIWQRWELPLE
jgi:glucosamine-6-phosphate deaminase